LVELVSTPEGHERYMNACVIPYEEQKNKTNGSVGGMDTAASPNDTCT